MYNSIDRAGMLVLKYSRKCGSSSMVERQLPKLNVAGSSPVFRLYFFIIFGDFFIAKGNGASYVNVV